MLRLEKGYRAWGRELTPDDTPFQAGLGWAVKLDKPGGFIGHKALLEAKAKPLARRLVSVVLDDREPLLWGGEALLRDGKPVGDLTSAGYGHTVGASVGLGYVQREDGAAIDAAWLDGRQVRGRPRRHAASRPRSRCAARSIRPAPASRADHVLPDRARPARLMSARDARGPER